MRLVSQWCSRWLELAVPVLCAVIGTGALLLAARLALRLSRMVLPPALGLLAAVLLAGMAVAALLTLGAGGLQARVSLVEHRIRRHVERSEYPAAANAARAAFGPRWFPVLHQRFRGRAEELEALAQAHARARCGGERVLDDA